MATEMRVWIGCLACYNNGDLRGEWHDAIEAGDVTPEQIHGGATDHEELWCMDTEGLPGGEMSPSEAQRIAEALEDLDDDEREIFRAWFDASSYTTIDDAAVAAFREEFCGEYDSEADYAEELAEESGAIKSGAAWPLNCIDWDRAWRELETGGDNYAIRTGHGGVWIFRNA